MTATLVTRKPHPKKPRVDNVGVEYLPIYNYVTSELQETSVGMSFKYLVISHKCRVYLVEFLMLFLKTPISPLLALKCLTAMFTRKFVAHTFNKHMHIGFDAFSHHSWTWEVNACSLCFQFLGFFY